ncbi:MAG: metallopeptidase TldD-related protein, partial [Casimicrobiaceae bacterium]
MNAPMNVAAASAFGEGYFRDIAGILDGLLAPGEFYTAWFRAETSAFVRFNHGKVRQPGTVVQCYLDVDLVAGERHATHSLVLCGDRGRDQAVLAAAIGSLRAVLPMLAPDPHLLHATEVHSSCTVRGGPLPPAEAIVDEVLAAADGLDFVGLYAGGPVARGFANAHGQRNWHESTSFNLQWSLYHRVDKAVKSSLAGFAWDSAAFAAKMRDAQVQLAVIARPSRVLAPGRYRTFLAPAAMAELMETLAWDGFSARALATQQSSLARMQGPNGARLDPRVHLVESVADGTAPGFQSAGFIRPERVPLIVEGRLVAALTSPRTAREFGGTSNGANPHEMADSLVMAGGELANADVLAALDTGLYVGNFWYLNYSDRPACRITGMTRFATFWVEGGKIVEPVEVLRFDDTLLRMLGENLASLTRET